MSLSFLSIQSYTVHWKIQSFAIATFLFDECVWSNLFNKRDFFQLCNSSHSEVSSAKPVVNMNCLFEQNTHFILPSVTVSPTTILLVSLNGSHQEMKLINNHLLHFVYPVCISWVTGFLPTLFLSQPHWREQILINFIRLNGPDVCVVLGMIWPNHKLQKRLQK